MPYEGRSTYLGWLYYGNHAEWYKKTEVQLKAQCEDADLDLITYEAHPRCSKNIVPPPIWTYLQESLRRTVSPELIARIPEYDVMKTSDALRKLRKYAQPFRFMDLPKELRLMVYEEALSKQSQHGRMCGRARSVGWPDEPFPDVLNVCHAIRAEASPLFFASFELELQAVVNDSLEALVKGLQYFVQRFLRDNAKLLGFLELTYVNPPWEGYGRLTLEFDKREGLCVDIDNVEEDRKSLGLQGEAIILAITSKPELWVEDYWSESDYDEDE